MKRWVFSIAIIFMLLAFKFTALAFTPTTARIGILNANTNTYDYGGYNAVSLIYNGKSIQSDVPAFIKDGRTMVPVRIISEQLGANVDWTAKTRQVTIKYQDTSVLLTIDSAQATLNGKNVGMPDGVPAVLADYNGIQRTFVPLKFVAEGLGAEVKWDGGTYTVNINKTEAATNNNTTAAATTTKTTAEDSKTYYVTGIKSNSDVKKFTVVTSKKASYDVLYYNGTLAIDIFNAKLDSAVTSPALLDWVTGIKYSQYDGYTNVKNVVRVVITLKSGTVFPDNVSVIASDTGIDIKLKPATKRALSSYIVVIDPGHGGSDPGAVSDKYHEADVNLNLALRVQTILKSSGVNVIMTRTTDKDVSLEDRADMANKAKADIFVSIHVNASGSTQTATGIETYCFKTGGYAEALAGYLQSDVIKSTSAANRGVKTANYYVLKYTQMPAALVETGFISTPSECALLFTDSYRDKLAKGIAAGIIDYLNNDAS